MLVVKLHSINQKLASRSVQIKNAALNEIVSTKWNDLNLIKTPNKVFVLKLNTLDYSIYEKPLHNVHHTP